MKITDEMAKKAAVEFLSYRGERPFRVTRRGAELWEDYTEAMRFALTAALSAAPAERPPYDLRLAIGKALDRCICDDSTPEQVDKFMAIFAECGLSIGFAAPAVGVKATEWVADRETLAEAALDQSLPDGSVRALCLAKKGDVSELIESWAALATTEGKDNG